MDATVHPEGSLEVLSQREVAQLCDQADPDLYALFRRCALAVLNCGSYVDDARAVFDAYPDFDVGVVHQQRGVRLDIVNAPAHAFVDGNMIRGIREHLFAVLRDILYVHGEIAASPRFDLGSPGGITDAVFNILRNANVLKRRGERGVVVCWGGHAIGREEYDYTKEVGYALGLRGADVCTGCGPGAMKGPMKGATIGHAKQRIRDGRYLGVTEPGIIAAESPNPIVNELVIMPDMEKRLEAFLRIAHAIVVFPGGAGTAEEILYLAGVLMHPRNARIHLPVVLTGPAASERYFSRLLEFMRLALGEQAVARFELVIDDSATVARTLLAGIGRVHAQRREHNDAYFFNWQLHIEPALQTPFPVTHASMAALDLGLERPPHDRAAMLRRLFSGIVAGNVKDEGVRAIERHGPFEIRCSREILAPLDALLAGFAADGRMKLPGARYAPCYRLVS
ncbi:MAG: LOG family protein [Gammaproteobacteria bacterium]|nr:LOG family protein [Gammaproteobacteria bacterium]